MTPSAFHAEKRAVQKAVMELCAAFDVYVVVGVKKTNEGKTAYSFCQSRGALTKEAASSLLHALGELLEKNDKGKSK